MRESSTGLLGSDVIKTAAKLKDPYPGFYRDKTLAL